MYLRVTKERGKRSALRKRGKRGGTRSRNSPVLRLVFCTWFPDDELLQRDSLSGDLEEGGSRISRGGVVKEVAAGRVLRDALVWEERKTRRSGSVECREESRRDEL